METQPFSEVTRVPGHEMSNEASRYRGPLTKLLLACVVLAPTLWVAAPASAKEWVSYNCYVVDVGVRAYYKQTIDIHTECRVVSGRYRVCNRLTGRCWNRTEYKTVSARHHTRLGVDRNGVMGRYSSTRFNRNVWGNCQLGHHWEHHPRGVRHQRVGVIRLKNRCKGTNGIYRCSVVDVSWKSYDEQDLLDGGWVRARSIHDYPCAGI